MIIPSIDLSNNKIVHLRQGKEVILKESNIDKVINKYKYFSEVNVIDIDSAKGIGENTELIKYICTKLNCNIGGGIRTVQKAWDYINLGAKSIIIGTNANVEFLSKMPKEKLIVALDNMKGMLAIKGWQEFKEFSIKNKIKELEDYCNGFIVTNIDVEGLNQGVNMDYIKSLQGLTKKRIIVAGGITTLEEVREINSYGFDQVMGLAIATGKLDIVKAFLATLDFKKQNLIPTVVQDVETKKVLMLAYSNEESLMETFKSGYAVYYSRSRECLWKKGETSGNFQEISKIYIDCDNDTILFKVFQKGKACHKNTFSCFR